MNARQILYHIFNLIAKLVVYLTNKKDKTEEIQDVRAKIKGSVDCFKWLTRNLRYRHDKEDWEEWKAPVQTFEDKAGDCEDWAVLAYYFLKGKIDSLQILCMYPDDGVGHATLLINGNITLANWGIVNHKTQDVFKISKYFMRDCTNVALYEMDFWPKGLYKGQKKVIRRIKK